MYKQNTERRQTRVYVKPLNKLVYKQEKLLLPNRLTFKPCKGHAKALKLSGILIDLKACK